MSGDEIARLEREITERTERLTALRKPMTQDQLIELGRTNPTEFNRRVDQGLIPADAFANREEDQ